MINASNGLPAINYESKWRFLAMKREFQSFP